MNESMNEIKRIAYETGYTPFMITQLMKNFPSDYMSVINAFGKPPLQTIRVNTLKTSPNEVKQKLEAKGFLVRPSDWIDYAFHVSTIDSELQLGATHEYLEGLYYLQSHGSMIPPHLLFPVPGDQVIDMCAAPGSKTTQMGQMMDNKGILIASDIKKSRVKSLNFNLKRIGVYNCITFPYDARHLKTKIPGFKPNKILLDAPCSGSGIIRTDSTPMREKSDVHIKKLAKMQKELLLAGLDMLLPDGYLMYSTCSFHHQENEQVIAEVIAQRDDIEIIEPSQNIGLPGLDHVEGLDFGFELLKTRRLYPNLHDTDAFYMALLQKKI